MQEQNGVSKDNVDSTHQANNEVYEYKTIEHQKEKKWISPVGKNWDIQQLDGK